MKRFYLIPLVIVLVSGLIFVGYRAPASAQPPIKIGVMFPLTGPMAMTGERMVTAAKFGFEEVANEVAGRKIEVIVEDSGAAPDMAMDKARKLVEFDEVSMLIGPLVATAKMAITPYMTEKKVPHINPQPCPWKMTEYEWSFLAGGSNYQHPSSMGRYAYEEMGLRRVTGMTVDIVDGHTFLGAFKDAFTKRGGQVIQEQYAPFGCPDYAPYLAALKDADAVAAWFLGADAIRFLTQLHKYGIRERMPLVGVFLGSFFQTFILRKLPPEVADAMIGERCPTQWTPFIETDVSKRFVKAFKKKQGYTPTEAESSPYSGVLVALEALKATGGDTTPEKLLQAIMALDIETPEGRIRFDPETRCALRNIYIIKVDKIGREYVTVPVYTYKDVPPRGY